MAMVMVVIMLFNTRDNRDGNTMIEVYNNISPPILYMRAIMSVGKEEQEEKCMYFSR